MEFALIAIAFFLLAKNADNVPGEVILDFMGVMFLAMAVLSAPYGTVF